MLTYIYVSIFDRSFQMEFISMFCLQFLYQYCRYPYSRSHGYCLVCFRLESLMGLDRSHITDDTLRSASWYQAGIPRYDTVYLTLVVHWFYTNLLNSMV